MIYKLTQFTRKIYHENPYNLSLSEDTAYPDFYRLFA